MYDNISRDIKIYMQNVWAKFIINFQDLLYIDSIYNADFIYYEIYV